MLPLDRAILNELRYGGATAKQLEERISGRIRHALDRLLMSDQVVKGGPGGKNYEFVFRQPPIKRRKLGN